MKNKDNIRLLYVDLFCGAGGTSTGVEQATLHGEKCAHVIACVNHDPNAIKSHAANHPDTHHFTEDIRTLEMEPLARIVRNARHEHPDAKVVLWASLECTNFSRAKGGQPRDADSRTLANHLFRYIEAINPDFIQIEDLDLFNIDWVIVGGESGNQARPMEKEWVLNIKRQCDEQGVPFFFKQWGTFGEDGIRRSKEANGHAIDGETYQAWPKE